MKVTKWKFDDFGLLRRQQRIAKSFNVRIIIGGGDAPTIKIRRRWGPQIVGGEAPPRRGQRRALRQICKGGKEKRKEDQDIFEGDFQTA